MRDQDCGCLPVKAGEGATSIVGLITDRDLVCRALADDLNPTMTPVSSVMSTPVETILESASDEECLQRMADRQVRRLVVLDGQGRCCGIIAQGDIAQKLPVQRTGDLVKEVTKPEKSRRAAGTGRVSASAAMRRR